MKKIYKYTKEDAINYAKEMSKSVVMRRFGNGDVRKPTPSEKLKVESAIVAALMAVLYGFEIESAKATAEFLVDYNNEEPGINTYDSVYIPIDVFLNDVAVKNSLYSIERVK